METIEDKQDDLKKKKTVVGIKSFNSHMSQDRIDHQSGKFQEYVPQPESSLNLMHK